MILNIKVIQIHYLNSDASQSYSENSKSNNTEKEESKDNESDLSIDEESETDFTNYFEEILPQKFTSDGEYFHREHVAEVMFRSKLFSEIEELEIIRTFYSSLKSIGDSDTKIFKLLTVYNRFTIFQKIIDTKMGKEIEIENEMEDKSISGIIQKSNYKSNLSKVDDIIFDASVHCLKTNNIPFFHKIIDNYRMSIEKRSLDIQKLIVQSFNKSYLENKQINYLFDKIKFMDSLTSSMITEISIVLKFINIMKKYMKCGIHINIFTSYHNPIRLFILLIKISNTFETYSTSVSIDLKIFQEEAETLILQIIDDWESIGILKKWLFDEFDEGLKVIDFLSHMDLLKILNNHKVSKIAGLIWNGNFDQDKNQTLDKAAKTSEVAFAFRDLNIDFDIMLTIVSKKRCCASVKYTKQIFTSIMAGVFSWK